LPASLKKIGKGAFAGCTNLVSLTFEGNAPSTHSFLSLAKEAKAHITPYATGFGNTFGRIPVIIIPSPSEP
jgi:hypothetical protein